MSLFDALVDEAIRNSPELAVLTSTHPLSLDWRKRW